jgi:pimeloyl-ACP methyl ester carboxylesterase
MKHVITIHGINSSGKWQEHVKGVLEPHFPCVAIKYPHYRRFGALKLVFEPWVLLGGGLLLLALYFGHEIRAGWSNWGASVLVLLFISHLCAGFRRNAASKYVKAEIDRHRSPGERPHVVAHSFGTFLIGTLMKRFPDLRFDAIILTGCTLPPTYDWGKLKQSRNSSGRIRNEVAPADWVLRLPPCFDG